VVMLRRIGISSAVGAASKGGDLAIWPAARVRQPRAEPLKKTV
jgi:hypothetical protein